MSRRDGYTVRYGIWLSVYEFVESFQNYAHGSWKHVMVVPRVDNVVLINRMAR
jgi:hypothetical protein